MIWREITYFGQRCVVACDAKCEKAWGINSRPKVELAPSEPDDYAFLADGELVEAPADPGTYEGGHAKPRQPSERLNKWCVRECERSALLKLSGNVLEFPELPDFSKRHFNMPWLHEQGGADE